MTYQESLPRGEFYYRARSIYMHTRYAGTTYTQPTGGRRRAVRYCRGSPLRPRARATTTAHHTDLRSLLSFSLLLRAVKVRRRARERQRARAQGEGNRAVGKEDGGEGVARGCRDREREGPTNSRRRRVYLPMLSVEEGNVHRSTVRVCVLRFSVYIYTCGDVCAARA